MILEETMLISNKLGLHARAAIKLVELTVDFDATITLSNDTREATTDTVMGLLMLESAQGEYITVRAEGPDADKAFDAVKKLVGAGFNEE